MNILDIISICIFVIFVGICAWRGLLKIVSKWAALFVAMIISKMLGGTVYFYLFESIFGGFAVGRYVTIVLLFAVSYFVLRLLFGMLAKAITKLLHTKTLDRILGGVVGLVGGFSVLFLFAFVLELILVVLTQFDLGEGLMDAYLTAKIFKFFTLF